MTNSLICLFEDEKENCVKWCYPPRFAKKFNTAEHSTLKCNMCSNFTNGTWRPWPNHSQGSRWLRGLFSVYWFSGPGFDSLGNRLVAEYEMDWVEAIQSSPNPRVTDPNPVQSSWWPRSWIQSSPIRTQQSRYLPKVVKSTCKNKRRCV